MSLKNVKKLITIINTPSTTSELANILHLPFNEVKELINTLNKHNLLKSVCPNNPRYQVNHIPRFLDKKHITTSITKFEKNCHIEIFDAIDSTNDYLLRTFSNKNNELSICLAEMQNSGKGRADKNWISPAFQNIYMSLSFKTNTALTKLAKLSLVIGLSVVKTLEQFAHDFKVKWPNDIYYQEKKISGTLIETKDCSSGLKLVVIGVGVNVNMLANLESSWVSLRYITGKTHDRNYIIPLLVENILNFTNLFLAEDFSAFEKMWTQYDLLYQKKITMNSFNDSVTGQYAGLNSNGEVILKVGKSLTAVPMHYNIESFD